MKTIAKLLAGLLALVFVLVIAGIVAFKFLADPERVKAEVVQLVAKQTGRELTIEGDLELSFIPWLGFKVGAMRLNNEEGFGDEPFAVVQGAEARVRLMPLFRKQIEVGTLAVRGLNLDMVRARSGASNWDDFVAEKEADKPAEKEGGFRARGIGRIEIEDANIRYRDLKAGDDYRFENVRLGAGPLVPDEPFDLELALQMAVDGDLNADISADARVQSDLEAGRYRAESVAATATLSGAAVGNKPVDARLSIDAVDLDTEAGTMNLAGVLLRALDAEIRTSLEGSDVMNKPAFKGPITVSAFSPRKAMQALGMEPPETADGSVLKEASLSAQLATREDRIDLGGLKARLDDTSISGSFSLTSIKRQRMAFDLSVDAIDLDRYLPPPSDEKGQASATDDAELPVEMLKKLDLNGTVRIGKLTAAGIQSSDVKATVKAANGNLRVNPSQAKLYGGQYSGDIRVSARGDAATLSMDETVSGVQAGAMLADMFDTSRLSGAADGRVRLSGTGKTIAGIRKTLSGDLSFQFSDGYLEGIDIWYEIQRAKALFGKAETPTPSKPARTRYSDLRGTAVVRDGVLRNDDLVAELPFLKLAGSGAINLVEATVDYRVNATVLKKPEVEADAQTADLVGARIPVRISGNLGSPTVAPDIAGWARSKAEDKIREKKDELLGKLLGKTGDKPAQEGEAGQEGEQPAEEKDPEEALKEQVEDKLKEKLKGLLGGKGDGP